MPLRPQNRKRQLGEFKDYTQDPNWRKSDPATGQAGTKGPVAAPVEVPQSVEDDMFSLKEMLKRLPFEFWMEGRRQLYLDIMPRDGRPFTVTEGEVNIAAGASAIVAEFEVEDRFVGFIKDLNLFVFQVGAYNAVEWTLLIDNVAYRGFQKFLASDANRNVFLPLQIDSGSSIQLQAENTDAAAVDVHAVMNGWTEFMSAEKGFDNLPGSAS